MNNPSFPQLRKDPIVDRWVLIAPERAKRPTELEELPHLTHHETCPFCEGREDETTPEPSFGVGSNDGPQATPLTWGG